MVDSRCRHCSHFPLRLRLLLPLLLTTAIASASSVNRTIDDETGDSVTGVVPTYSPPAAWKQGSTCSGCFVQLDPDHVLGGTWHDATHSPSDTEPLLITAHFTGTAVYVYNVLANTVPWTTTYTSLTFSLDGEQVGAYVHVPTSDTAFEYDVPVYTNAHLANSPHTLVIEATGDTNSSLVLFDYIVYTFTEEDSPPPSSSTTTTVAPPTTTSTATKPVTSPGITTSSSSSLSISLLSPTGSSSTLLSGSPSLGKLQTATSGNPSAPSTSSSSSSVAPTPTIAAANVDQHDSSFPVGAVAGGVAGGVIVIAVLLFLAWFLRKRRTQRAAPAAPFSLDGPDNHMRATSDALVSPGPYGAGGSGAHANGYGSLAHIGGSPSVSSPSTSGLPHATSSSAYLASVAAGSASTSRHNPHSESISTPSDYSSHPSTSDTAQQSDSSRAGLRPLPVPSSLRSASSATSPATTDPFMDPPSHARTDSSLSSRPSARAQPPVAVSEKSPLGPSETRLLPIPPIPSENATASLTRSNTTNTSILRTQVAALQEEVARLREQNEMQLFMDEAPPRYDEARV